jgi:hypothetical protein
MPVRLPRQRSASLGQEQIECQGQESAGDLLSCGPSGQHISHDRQGRVPYRRAGHLGPRGPSSGRVRHRNVIPAQPVVPRHPRPGDHHRGRGSFSVWVGVNGALVPALDRRSVAHRARISEWPCRDRRAGRRRSLPRGTRREPGPPARGARARPPCAGATQRDNHDGCRRLRTRRRRSGVHARPAGRPGRRDRDGLSWCRGRLRDDAPTEEQHRGARLGHRYGPEHR